MRAENNPDTNRFKEFLLKIRNGTKRTIDSNMIRIPDNMIIEWHDKESLQTLIETTYPLLQTRYLDASYFTDRAILTAKNEYVDYINDTILNKLPGDEVIYHSYDSVPKDNRNLYQQEFLNSIIVSDIPHINYTSKSTLL